MADPGKLALVHPWVAARRGGERAFFELVRAFPEGDVYFLHYMPDLIPGDIAGRIKRASFLQRWPFRALPYRAMLPLLPAACWQLDLTGYDTVISSSHGWGHAVRTRPGARHVCYMHSPPRYLWEEPPPSRSLSRIRFALWPLLAILRRWDRRHAESVSEFIANSEKTRDRIRSSYRRNSTVVYPPVDTERFFALDPEPKGYLIFVGELVPYKRVDLAIEATMHAGARLVVVGDGPDRKHLEALAEGGAITFVGRVGDAEVDRLMSGADALIHAGIEDFGIVMGEALAAGIPVIARAEGGGAEIVEDGVGILVTDPTPEAFASAIRRVKSGNGSVAARRASVQRFSIDRFRSEFRSVVRGTALDYRADRQPVGPVARP